MTISAGAVSVNYSWAAPAHVVGQMLNMGTFAGQFASFYALLVAQKPWQRYLGWAAWTFWVLIAVGTGSRGATVNVAMPAVVLIFVKHHAQAAHVFRSSFSVRAYVLTTTAFLPGASWPSSSTRPISATSTSTQRDLSQMSVTDLQGNGMFSEEPSWASQLRARRPTPSITTSSPAPTSFCPSLTTSSGLSSAPSPARSGTPSRWTPWPSGTTWPSPARPVTWIPGRTGISRGLAGHWYFPFGIFGVIEGGMFFGWLLVVAERAFQHAEGKPMRMIFSLGFLAFLFRSFRDINWQFLYPLIIVGVMLWVLVKLDRLVQAAWQPEGPPGEPRRKTRNDQPMRPRHLPSLGSSHP